jgi:hypothetical protein
MNVLIVHNDGTYGGAGFPGDGAASVSIHSLSSDIGIHELGHSLFGLGDEYTIGDGNPDEDPNCDSAGCSKWSDLIQTRDATCEPSKCRGGSYYGPSTNMMFDYSVKSFGAVNERITCCKYVYHTGVAPGYCSRFQGVGVGLTQYCNGQLWRGRYTNLNLLQTEHFQAVSNSSGKNTTKYMLKMAEDTQGDQYAFVEKPMEWVLEHQPSTKGDKDQWVCKQVPRKLQSGLYLRGQVMGDHKYTSFSGRHRDGNSLQDDYIEVEILDKSGKVDRQLFFDTQAVIEVPLDEQGKADSDSDSVLGARSVIEVVLREGEECQVRQNRKSSKKVLLKRN